MNELLSRIHGLLSDIDADLRKIDTVQLDLTADIDEYAECGNKLPEDIVRRTMIIDDYLRRVTANVETALKLAKESILASN